MKTLVIVLLVVVAACSPGAQAPPSEEHALRRVVALLDYVAADYGGAVRDGAVVSDAEYQEQLAFLKEAKERLASLTGHDDARAHVAEAIDQATQLAMAKASADLVERETRRGRALLVDGFAIRLGPSLAPSLERARALFAQTCSSCHGVTGGGDGVAAANLQPRPRSFRDSATTSTLSPVRAFSALADGVPGTAMVSFSALPEADRWSLAFYVTALRHEGAGAERGRAVVDRTPTLAAFDFATLADLREVDLEQRLVEAGIQPGERADALAFLRAAAPFQPRGSLSDIRRALATAKRSYSNDDSAAARHELTDAYLDGFEPLEARLLASAPELVRRVEDQFLALREGAEHGMSSAEFDADIDTLLVQLEAVDARLKGETSAWSAALAAFVVVVREGVESLLLVMLLLGLAKRAGAESDRRAVHLGWGLAIAVGVVTWFASAAVVALGGGNRELVEGLVALLAVVVLLYAGHFVLARMDAQRRIAALKRRFASISSGRRKLLLLMFSFIAAYREAFEVVLFLRAIVLGAPGAGHYVAIGAAAGLAACICIFLLISRVGKRLNTSLLLNAGGALLCLLAFVLAGKGIRSLQEAGWIGVSTIQGPRIDLLGIFPTLQTLAAQLLVIGIVVVVAWVAPRKPEVKTTMPAGGST